MNTRIDETLKRKIQNAYITSGGTLSYSEVSKRYNVSKTVARNIHNDINDIKIGEACTKDEINNIMAIIDRNGNEIERRMMRGCLARITDMMHENNNKREGVMRALRVETKRMLEMEMIRLHMDHESIWEKYYCNRERRDNKDWNSYSVIMPIDSGMRLVVYNSSHLLQKENGVCWVHRNTRRQLIIPKDVMMSVIFHGRLVHSGAAIQNNSTDYRWFSYFDVIDEDGKPRRNLKDPGESGGIIHTDCFEVCGVDCDVCGKDNNVEWNSLWYV